jgi:hypothetical protein
LPATVEIAPFADTFWMPPFAATKRFPDLSTVTAAAFCNPATVVMIPFGDTLRSAPSAM